MLPTSCRAALAPRAEGLVSPRSGKLLLCRAVVGGSRPLFALTCRPSSGNPRGDRPRRCQDRPTLFPPFRTLPPHALPRPSPWEGSRRRRSFLITPSCPAAWVPGAGRRRPVECRELLTAAGASWVSSWAVLGQLSCAVCASCLADAGAPAALGTNARVRQRQSGPPWASCASACARLSWAGASCPASWCPRASCRRVRRGSLASRPGACARPASGCARSGPRRRRGEDRRRRLGWRRAAPGRRSGALMLVEKSLTHPYPIDRVRSR